MSPHLLRLHRLHRLHRCLAIPRSESITKQANTPRSVPYTPLALPRLSRRVPCKSSLSQVQLVAYGGSPDLLTDHSSLSHPSPPLPHRLLHPFDHPARPAKTPNRPPLSPSLSPPKQSPDSSPYAYSATSFTFSQLPQIIAHLFNTPSHPPDARSLLCPQQSHTSSARPITLLVHDHFCAQNNRTPIRRAQSPT